MRNIDESKVNRILLFVIIFLQVITISIVVICSSCYNRGGNDEDVVNDTISQDDTNNEGIILENSTIKVDVKGAVKKAGVYELSVGTRVIDQTTPNMIQRINKVFERNPLISKGI